MSKSDRNSYFKRVYEVVVRIPKGKVTTYGAVAAYLGTVNDARMVGWALSSAPGFGTEPYLPCHRVVNKFGDLSGKASFGGDIMRERLQQEGVSFVDEFRVDLERCFWDPSGESDKKQ